jgi:hypothetical protein
VGRDCLARRATRTPCAISGSPDRRSRTNYLHIAQAVPRGDLAYHLSSVGSDAGVELGSKLREESDPTVASAFFGPNSPSYTGAGQRVGVSGLNRLHLCGAGIADSKPASHRRRTTWMSHIWSPPAVDTRAGSTTSYNDRGSGSERVFGPVGDLVELVQVTVPVEIKRHRGRLVPSIRWTTLMFTPDAMASDVAVGRSSCGCNPSSPSIAAALVSTAAGRPGREARHS